MKTTDTDQKVAEAKRVASVNDIIIPVPQGRVSIALLLEQAGLEYESGLFRDHQSPDDPWFGKEEIVEIAEGSVFYTGEPACDQRPTCDAPAKHVITLNDHPEIVVRSAQSDATIRRLFNVDETMEILIDTMSPEDPILNIGEIHNLEAGNVLLAKKLSIEVKVNNHQVHFTKRKVTGIEIKEPAINQGAVLEADFILSVKIDGIHKPIEDAEQVCLLANLCFLAISPDDNSYDRTSVVTTEIETCLIELKKQYPEYRIEAVEVADGVNILVYGVKLGERYDQNETWIGFHIHASYPQGDIYPHFVRNDLSPKAGYKLPPAMHQQKQFAGRTALMVSRRSKRWNPLADSAIAKLSKVIRFIKEG